MKNRIARYKLPSAGSKNRVISTPSEGVTILGDDLFSRQPFCQTLKDKQFISSWCVSLICIPICIKR